MSDEGTTSTPYQDMRPAVAIVRGVGASPGISVGPARIIRTDDDWARVRPGDVVISARLPLAGSSAIRAAAALVANKGGALSNAANAARARRVPAVVAARDATSRFHDGELLRVDGRLGTVSRPSCRS